MGRRRCSETQWVCRVDLGLNECDVTQHLKLLHWSNIQSGNAIPNSIEFGLGTWKRSVTKHSICKIYPPRVANDLTQTLPRSLWNRWPGSTGFHAISSRLRCVVSRKWRTMRLVADLIHEGKLGSTETTREQRLRFCTKTHVVCTEMIVIVLYRRYWRDIHAILNEMTVILLSR